MSDNRDSIQVLDELSNNLSDSIFGRIAIDDHLLSAFVRYADTDHDQLDREKATDWGVVMTFLNSVGHIARHRGYKAVRRDCSQS